MCNREPGVWALERAKQNVLENYLLVGILEELEDVLLLLERLLPHYFTGVLNIYKSPGRQMLPISICYVEIEIYSFQNSGSFFKIVHVV